LTKRIVSLAVRVESLRMTLALDKATTATFEPYVGTSFSVRIGETSLDLILERIAELGSSPQRPRSFSLYFRLDAQGVLPQQTYELTHPALGDLAIFLVPIAEPGKGVLYEAVFN